MLTGLYQNTPRDNIRGKIATQLHGVNSNEPVISDEISHFASRINRACHSDEGWNNTVPRQGIAIPLLMLLSQFRLADSPLSAPHTSRALTVERNPLSPVLRNTDINSNGLGIIMSPLTTALFETAEFIARHDPLIFPVANASPVPLPGAESTMATDIVGDLKSGSYIITDEQKKDELISSLVQYLVHDGQLTVNEGKDIELRLWSEAAGTPMVAARLDNEYPVGSRPKRALAAENDPRTAVHIKKYCAFEEEVLDAQEVNKGKVLLFQAQRAENPFRMIYDNNPDSRPSPEERGVAEGLKISAEIITLGIAPLIGKLIANVKRREYYQNQGDEICAERFRRLFFAELATSLDVDGLKFRFRASIGKVKPTELLHALPEPKRAAFYTRNPLTGIRKEILLELKHGQGAINDNGRKVYLKPTEKINEFVTYYPDAAKPEWLERRVIVDESNLSWRYADSFDSTGLNVEISEGKRQITLSGENYQLEQNAVGVYEIIVNEGGGVKKFIPVYMEPLSKTWHLSTHNKHPAFNDKQSKLINEIKAQREKGFYYIPRGNNNKNLYGQGNIYVQEKIGDYGHYAWGRYVEMNGELLPVRNTKHQGHGVLYEVYDRKFPDKEGYPIEWDGNRWLFERQTSVHVSEALRNQITPAMYSKHMDMTTLSAPDHMGLRIDPRGTKYLKINGQFVKLEKREGSFFIKENNDKKLLIDFKNNEFTLHNMMVADMFDARNLANIDISEMGINSMAGYKNIYVANNGHLYIKLNNKHYPVEFMGKDRRVVFIGSPNEMRLSCIYSPQDGSIKNIGNNLGQHTLKYNRDIDIYIGTDRLTEETHFMRFDNEKNNLVNTRIYSVNKINDQLNKVGFKEFDLYIPKKTPRDIYLAAHAARDITLSSQIPANIELAFYTEKGKSLYGHVDDLQDLVNGKFNTLQSIKKGEFIEGYAISFDYDSQINYAQLAIESNKSIIKIKERREVKLKDLLRDISSLSVEDKTLHLYMCRAF
ncbi:putative adhesin [unidentified bacterial endosymbiont]|uniref:putative adhesin n=1 Tax=unidentified bacterial endosymbiont TaxID=2355 RepID=UPI0020A0C619|nr:hypothetical protein [unidentified bacterial endosymbiont]